MPRCHAERWPNGLGWMLHIGRRLFELWPSGSLVLCKRDDSLAGYLGMRYAELGVCPDSPEGAILLARAAIHTPELWKPCYDA